VATANVHPLSIVGLELTHMTSLPLSFRVRNAVVEKHQLEGMDPSDRYFNRMIPITRVERGYSGTVMYEALNIQSQVYRTVLEVLKDITDQLRELGFTKMRTRLNFKGQKYLAEKETWIDYADA
jgi:hypothetical protein